MLSSSTRSAPAVEHLARPARRVSHSTSTGTPGNALAHRLERRRDAAGRDDVVVLDQRGVGQRHAVVDAAAAAHRVLLQRPQARAWSCGCRGCARRCRRPRRPSARVSVATPDRWHSRLSAVRSAVSSVAHRAVGLEHRVARATAGRRRRPSAPQLDAGHDDVEDGHRDRRGRRRRRRRGARTRAMPRRSAGTVATLVTSLAAVEVLGDGAARRGRATAAGSSPARASAAVVAGLDERHACSRGSYAVPRQGR